MGMIVVNGGSLGHRFRVRIKRLLDLISSIWVYMLLSKQYILPSLLSYGRDSATKDASDEIQTYGNRQVYYFVIGTLSFSTFATLSHSESSTDAPPAMI